MQSLGATHLVVLFVFVALVLDSRRLRSLARSTPRDRRPSISGRGIPAGANPDRVGITLGQIQMRNHVDWQDGGIGWEGPEILPADDVDDTDDGDATPRTEPNTALPVIWKPFPALPAAGATGDWPQAETLAQSNPASWSGAVFNCGPRPLAPSESSCGVLTSGAVDTE